MSLLARSLLLVTLGSLAACSSPSTPAPTGASTSPAPFACATPLEGADALGKPGAVVLFGEVHGTAEIPDIFGRAVCAAAAAPTDVLVGLEIPRTEQAGLDAFVASAGGPAARAALLAGAFWHGVRDGRNSEAMVALLDRVRVMRAAGADLRIVAFDIAPGTSGNRDESMARALIAARDGAPDAALIVLTGNLHARLAGGLPPLPEMVPMGSYLREAAPDVISFDARHAVGTAWVCFGGDDCGVNQWGEGDDPGGARVTPAPEAQAEGYAGVFHVGGPVTASLPAVPAR